MMEPPFPIGSKIRPVHKYDKWMGIKTVTRWEPMTFNNGKVEWVLWMERDDGVEHYHRNTEDTWELVEAEHE